MKAALQIRQKQQLALTPQLQQAIHLLQLSTADLEQEIDRAISQNPFLERLDAPRTDTIALRADGSLRAPVHDDWAGMTATGQHMGSPSGGKAINTGMTAGTEHIGEGKAGTMHTASPDAPPSFDGPGDIARTGASERDIATGNDPDTMGEGWDLDYDTAASHGDDAWGSGMGTGSADGSEGDDAFNPALSTEPTLQAHLLAQLGEIRCTPRQHALITLLIWELRDDGYFPPGFSLEALAASALLPGERFSSHQHLGHPPYCHRPSVPQSLSTPPAPHVANGTPVQHASMDRAQPAHPLPAELDAALATLQGFEPAGVGARSPGECLRLQLLRLQEDLPVPQAIPSQNPTPDCGTAPALIDLALQLTRDDCLPLLADHRDELLCRRLRCTPAMLGAARTLIRSLDPHPGNRFGHEPPGYITPDVTARHTGHGWRAELNHRAQPRLRVHDEYESLLKKNNQSSETPAAQNRKSGAEWEQQVTEDSHDESASQPATGPAAGHPLLQQLQEARSLACSVQQRGETILQVAQAIIDRQKPFFSHGPEALRPLVLRDIAEAVGRHETTVSRACTQKYLRTPFGIFELKYFFGSHVATDTGGHTASGAIRAQIEKLIQQENPHQPLTDTDLTEMLGQRGIQVARRTVAKYRESLNILPAAQRRSR